MSASDLPLVPSNVPKTTNMLSNIFNNIKSNKKTLYIIVGIAIASLIAYFIYKKYFDKNNNIEKTHAPQTPQQDAPQTPQTYAPQTPQTYAPQTPQTYAPQTQQEHIDEMEQIYENNDKITELTASEVERLNEELENS